ncbi:MAG: hypothetical protein WC464_07635 [Bdellovibrionales bacterium]
MTKPTLPEEDLLRAALKEIDAIFEEELTLLEAENAAWKDLINYTTVGALPDEQILMLLKEIGGWKKDAIHLCGRAADSPCLYLPERPKESMRPNRNKTQKRKGVIDGKDLLPSHYLGNMRYHNDETRDRFLADCTEAHFSLLQAKKCTL